MRSLTWMCIVAAVVAQPDPVGAQGYPAKPVRVVTAAAGAGGDFVSRIVAAGLTEIWGQQVVVDNRGGSAVIPIEVVAKAPPDGYTLLGFGTALWHLDPALVEAREILDIPVLGFLETTAHVA